MKGSDLAMAFYQETAILNEGRRQRVPKAKIDTTPYVVGRQKALGQFRTLPGSTDFETKIQDMGTSITKLWEAFDAPEEGKFDSAYLNARSTVRDFMTAVGDYIGR
jgi:hypothetical protein